MAKTKISEFSSTPGNNTDIDNINIAEGCAPSGINNAIRELMAQLKDFQAGTAGDSFNGPIGTTTAAAGVFTTLSASGAFTYGGVTLSNAVTGTGNMVLSTSPTLVTPALGTPSALVGTNITGTAAGLTAGNVTTNANLTGAVTSVGNATSLGSFTSANLAGALTDETGSGAAVFANSPTLITPALGTPASGVVTNLTGTASININGTVGATTASTGAFTTLTTSSTVTHNGGTANGVAYLNGSKVLTTGSALVFDGTNLGVGALNTNALLTINGDKTALRVERGSAIGFAYNTGTAGTDSFRIQSNAGPVDIYTASGQPITFSAGAAEQMRLTSTGLGIGTSSPAAKLESVQATSGAGGWFMAGQFSSATATMIRLASTTANKYSSIGNDSDGGLYFLVNGTAGAVGTTAAILNPSGNLGLGVTPSAWGGSYKAIQLAGGSLASFSNSALDLYSNAYDSGAGAWKYVASLAATRYAQSDGKHIWFNAPIGTAGNAISFSQAMTLDASGRLGIGNTSPDEVLVVKTSAGNVKSSALNSGAKWVGTNAANNAEAEFGLQGNPLVFLTNGSERARIDSSGNLLIGKTTSGNYTNGCQIYANGETIGLGHASTTGSGAAYLLFGWDNGGIGSITQNGTTAVAYNTSSDYRLKNTIAPMTGALAKVALLKPCTYKWNADGSDGEGFIAHELAEVVPQCVTGEKDAVDAEGKPKYQGIDTSFLVATLTAAIQELKAEFDAYKASHP